MTDKQPSAPPVNSSQNSAGMLPIVRRQDGGAETEHGMRAALSDLEERFWKFKSLELPGQPQIMHVGSMRLVDDLWREIRRLREERPTPLPSEGEVVWRWPRALNVKRSSDNYWHGDISFARCPTDEELQNLDAFLNSHHENATPPSASPSVREAVRGALRAFFLRINRSHAWASSDDDKLVDLIARSLSSGEQEGKP